MKISLKIIQSINVLQDRELGRKTELRTALNL
ncbi:uncharacterized protein METZ01_LOCUS390113, partial [marine metagenome]